MTSHPTERDELLQQLIAMRRHIRTLQAIVAGLCAAALLVVTIAATTQNATQETDTAGGDRLRARSLELVDDGGTTRVRCGVLDEGGTIELSMHDRAGIKRLALQVEATGDSSVSMLDQLGAVRVEAAFLNEGTPRLVLHDSSRVERAKLFLMPDGSPLLYLKDREGNPRVELAHLWTGLSGLIAFDASKQLRLLLGETPSGDVSLRITDTKQRVRAELGIAPDQDDARLKFFDIEGIEQPPDLP